MKYWFPVCMLCCLLVQNLFGQFVLHDTLFIKRDQNEENYHRIFYETHKNAIFYQYAGGFKMDNPFAKETYTESVRYLLKNHPVATKPAYGNFPLEWVLVNMYNGKICLYSPCDYYSHYKRKFTNSILIDWDGEGPEARRIKRFQKIDSAHYRIEVAGRWGILKTIEVTMIDQAREIAVFHDTFYGQSAYPQGERFSLMITVRKMRELPFIVNLSDNMKMPELDFDEIDYPKIAGSFPLKKRD